MATTMASSLVSCLRFAVPLVRSDANASSICSKSTLGAMVMEAHRLAQQAVAAVDLDLNDPRRVLTKLVPLDDELSRLAFNDITWDSEGIVAQSLEMELQDLEERASASQPRNFCVLLTARPTDGFEDGGESALLWFPRTGESDGNNSSQKYLLYVVPGRIKIVKSLAELVKKMLEEIPTLRSSSATYHIWTLIEAKKKMKEKPILEEPASLPEKKRAQEASVIHPKREETPEEVLEPVLLQAAKPKPLRVRVHERGLTDQPSMFQFPRLQQPTKPSAPVYNELSESKRSLVRDEPLTQTANGSHSPSPTVGFDAEPSPNASGSPIIRQSDSKSRDVRTKAFVSCTTALPRQVPSGQSDGQSGWRSLDGENRRLVVIPAPQPAPTNAPDTVVQPTTKAQIRLLQRERAESMFQFSGSHELERPLQRSKSHSSERNQVAEEKHHEKPQLAPDPIVDTSQGGSREIVDDAVTEFVKPKKRSARDHYRNKLGARGWWELEYQASKILEQQLLSHQPQVTHANTVGVRGDRHAAEGAGKLRDEVKKPSLPTPVEATAHAPHCTPEKTTDLTPEKPQQNKRETISQVVESPVRSNRAIKDLGDHVGSHELSPSRQERNAKVQSAEPTPQSARAWQEGIVQVRSSMRVSRVERSDAKVQSPERPSFSASNQDIVHPVRDIVPLRVTPSTLKENDITAERTTFQTMPTTGEDDFVEVPAHTSPVIRHTSSLKASEAERYQARSPMTKAAQEQGKPEEHVSTNLFARKRPSKQEVDEQDSVLMATMAPRGLRGANIHNDDRWEPTDKSTSGDDASSIHARPFHALGRVPIRSRQEKDSRPRQSISPVSSDDDEDTMPFVAPLKTTTTTPETPVIAPTKTSAPPVVESFTVESPVRSHDEATQRARQQKLTELRQKKIQQLQKARDEAMGKKKRSLPKAAPASELLLDRAISVGPPTTTAGADESFSMPGHSTLARVRKPSNRKLIQNAIEYTLLAGGSLDKERHAALQALSESSCDNFIVLLKSAKELKFRALYEHHVERGRVVRIFSTTSSSPPVLTDDVISQFFRYNSGKKEFAAIDAREFTVKTDACALADHLVFKKKALNRIL